MPKFCQCKDDVRVVESLVEVMDRDAVNLSHVGQSVYETLRKKFGKHHNKEWDVSSGKVIGKFHQTPRLCEPITECHSNWFPEKMSEIIGRTERWCDILSLSPPDGLFLIYFKEALQAIDARSRQLDDKGEPKPPVIVRMMFGNLVGMPVNCDAVIKTLTEDLPKDGTCNIQVWVGAWRRSLSWNHAKIIAVDGKYLHTGGHNLWDKHYLQDNPVHDLSLEMEGEITHNAHTFANFQWNFVKKAQSTRWGQIAEKIPDSLPTPWKTRVIVSQFPEDVATEFPPTYVQEEFLLNEKIEGIYPVIGVGRLGTVTKYVNRISRHNRPADYALVAMINSARDSIKMVLQDLGPIAFPGTKIPLPGLVWPKNYLTAIGHAIFRRGVNVSIILSNPQSRPSNLVATDGAYGNGYTCTDVAIEIVKCIRREYSSVKTDALREKVTKHLRISYIKRNKGITIYENGATIALHSKHFIVDDTCFYIGSQNLYFADLAEWGVIVDNTEKTEDVLEEYWNPLWSTSYSPDDCDMDLLFETIFTWIKGKKKKTQKKLKRTINRATLTEYMRGPSMINTKYYKKEVC